jgi:hypothetical protein
MVTINPNELNNSTTTEIPVFYTLMTEADLTQLIAIAVKEAFEARQGVEIAPNPHPDDLLTRKEAAKEFKVCVATIDNYKNKGLIIPSRLSGTVRYRRGDLQAAFSNSIINPYKIPKRKRS